MLSIEILLSGFPFGHHKVEALYCRYLLEHPEYATEGVKLSQFSFQIPRPLQENYVRKRTIPIGNPNEMTRSGLSRPLEPAEGIYVVTCTCSVSRLLQRCDQPFLFSRTFHFVVASGFFQGN